MYRNAQEKIFSLNWDLGRGYEVGDDSLQKIQYSVSAFPPYCI